MQHIDVVHRKVLHVLRVRMVQRPGFQRESKGDKTRGGLDLLGFFAGNRSCLRSARQVSWASERGAVCPIVYDGSFGLRQFGFTAVSHALRGLSYTIVYSLGSRSSSSVRHTVGHTLGNSGARCRDEASIRDEDSEGEASGVRIIVPGSWIIVHGGPLRIG